MDYRSHFYKSACGKLELFARDYAGDGPTLLLMHGLTRNSADFEPLVPLLIGRYRLIVPDQRGRGLSDYDPDPAHYRPDFYAQDMFALLDSLEVDQAGLIGTSMGGLISMVMTATQPDRITALVLNDVGPVLDPAGLERIGGYVGGGNPFPNLPTAAQMIAQHNVAAFPDFEEADWIAFAKRTTRQSENGGVEFAYDPAISEGFANLGDQDQPDMWPLWQMMQDKPVLSIRGARSDLLSAETVERMKEEHSGPFASVDVIGRGHAPLLDEAEAQSAIELFLAEHLG